MKKIIVILTVLIVAVTSIYAGTGTPAGALNDKEEILVTCEVKEDLPTYQLFASLTGGTESTSTGMIEAEKVDSVKSATTSTLTAQENAIINAALPVYCVIRQAKDARYTASVTLTVAATALSGYVGDTPYATDDPTISDISAANDIEGARTTTSATGTKIVNIAYTGKKAEAADIASFTVTWPQTDLPPATYNAYITMTLTAI